jgi:hypothetical protein
VTATVQRRYRMVKVAAGDWLLPGNDGRTLWRVYRYREEGDAYWTYDLDTPILGDFWAIARYERPIGDLDADEVFMEDFLDWGKWETWRSVLRSRRDAVDAALKADVS